MKKLNVIASPIKFNIDPETLKTLLDNSLKFYEGMPSNDFTI